MLPSIHMSTVGLSQDPEVSVSSLTNSPAEDGISLNKSIHLISAILNLPGQFRTGARSQRVATESTATNNIDTHGKYSANNFDVLNKGVLKVSSIGIYHSHAYRLCQFLASLKPYPFDLLT